jgi:hypothetical protein
MAVPLFVTVATASAQETSFRSALSASTTIAVAAHKRGTIGVNLRSVLLAFDSEAGRPLHPISVPLAVTWNVSPTKVSAVEVIAYFDDPHRAMADSRGSANPSRHVSERIRAGSFSPFNQTDFFGPAGGSMRVFGETISHGNSRATRNDILQIRLDEATSGSPRMYSVVLNLESRYY